MPKRRTHEEFIKEIYDLVGEEYTVLSKFTGVDNKVKFRHNTNGNEFMMTPYHFINRGQRDPKLRRTRGITNTLVNRQSNFDRLLKKVQGSKYSRIDSYKTAKTPIKFYDHEHNEEFVTKPDNLLRGFGNPKYKSNKRKTTEEFKQEVYDLVGNEYSVLSDYKQAYKKVKFKHNINGNTFEMTPHNFLRGQRDPLVTQPKGEAEIMNILEDKGIKYEYQHVLPHKGARIHGLRPDFYLPEYNAFIEFDGQQHFYPIGIFGGQQAYDKQVIKDARKNAYAYEHGIKMIRIHYSLLGHIEEFLQPFFERYGKVDNIGTFVV